MVNLISNYLHLLSKLNRAYILKLFRIECRILIPYTKKENEKIQNQPDLYQGVSFYQYY